MKARLKVVAGGAQTSIQDLGRPGYGRFGVPVSGAADPVYLRLGNALVGNAESAPAIEMRLFGPTVTCEGAPLHLGLAGWFNSHVIRAETKEEHLVAPWQSLTLFPGDTLVIREAREGLTGYLTMASDLESSPALGSHATYSRARLGGLGSGEMLGAGDIISLDTAEVPSAHSLCLNPSSLKKDAPIRVILGPQDDYFSTAQKEAFFSTSYTVGAAADRMGIRLEGSPLPNLEHLTGSMISDGLVTGAIQIPGTGLPILLGVDCQTIGGYPKIATVISADRHLLGQLKPGDTVRFAEVDLEAAKQAALALEAEIAHIIASKSRFYPPGSIDEEALYQNNLIGGMVNATDPDRAEDTSIGKAKYEP